MNPHENDLQCQERCGLDDAIKDEKCCSHLLRFFTCGARQMSSPAGIDFTLNSIAQIKRHPLGMSIMNGGR